MSNQNPIKQARYSGEALTAREKARRVKHMPRVRLAGEAMPYAISIFGADNVYRPVAVLMVRPGADNHLRQKSLAGGVSC